MHRSGDGKSAENRILSTFLNETDGLTTTTGDRVLVIGATNRPSTLDAALLRPGRFDKVIYVPPPDYSGRVKFLETLLQQMGKVEDLTKIDILHLAKGEISGKLTGAEIAGAMREAAARCLRESLLEKRSTPRELTTTDLENALLKVNPLLGNDLIVDEYDRFERTRRLN